MDLSFWIFQAVYQRAIAGIFSPYAAILKVLFDRVRFRLSCCEATATA